jgi:hypothetical protein
VVGLDQRSAVLPEMRLSSGGRMTPLRVPAAGWPAAKTTVGRMRCVLPRYDVETGRQWATEVLVSTRGGGWSGYRGCPDLLQQADELTGGLVSVTWIPCKSVRNLQSLTAARSES